MWYTCAPDLPGASLFHIHLTLSLRTVALHVVRHGHPAYRLVLHYQFLVALARSGGLVLQPRLFDDLSFSHPFGPGFILSFGDGVSCFVPKISVLRFLS